jgi:hypothetical protein
MIKLKAINKELKEKHLQWANKRILTQSVELNEKLQNYFDKFEDLIIGDNLKELIKEFEKNEPNEELDKELKNIFNYKRFSRGDNNWGRNKFISELNIKTCPYCNRQYITNYQFEDKCRTTADLDHFYSQSKYPYLALNIYNFIPSCSICNRSMKGSKEMGEAVYPYEDEFGKNGEFKIKSDNIIPVGKDDLEIGIEVSENNERIEKSIEIFKLIFVSHSPFLLSDMLSENCIFLDKEENKTKIKKVEIKSFGANIHELLKRGMFMESTFGEFSRNKIKKIVKKIQDKNDRLEENEIEEINFVIDSIGEPLVADKLRKMLKKKIDNDNGNEMERYKKKIEELELELERLNKNIEISYN